MIDWLSENCAEKVPVNGEEEIVVANLQGLVCVVKILLRITIQFAGIALFIMLLVGGFKYLTSGGDSKATESAKITITYAVFGLALLIGAWLILLLIREITGIDVTQFEISGP